MKSNTYTQTQSAHTYMYSFELENEANERERKRETETERKEERVHMALTNYRKSFIVSRIFQHFSSFTLLSTLFLCCCCCFSSECPLVECAHTHAYECIDVFYGYHVNYLE